MREVPDAMKPKKVMIGGARKLEVVEGDKAEDDESGKDRDVA